MAAAWNPQVADANQWETDFQLGQLYYFFNDDGVSVTVTRPRLSPAIYYTWNYKLGGNRLVIPPKVEYAGKVYTVNHIADETFRYCSYLTEVVIPNTIIGIGRMAFAGCKGLTHIEIPNSVTYLVEGAFKDSGLTEVELPESLFKIGAEAFAGTPWYEQLRESQPDGVVYSGTIAFEYKGEMPPGTVVTIKDGTRIIAGDCFNGRSAMTNVVLPASLVTIGERAFYRCENLTDIHLPPALTNICDEAFIACLGLKNVTIPNSVHSIGKRAFSGCQSLENLMLPNSITNIGDGAFSSTGLKEIIIPSSVEVVGQHAFTYCRALERVEILAPLTIINGYTFTECAALKNVSLPNTVIKIDRGAFQRTGLESIVIPESVTTIGAYAFYNKESESNLKRIYCKATTPPAIFLMDSRIQRVFNNTDPANATLFVPTGCKPIYMLDEFWGEFQRIEEMDFDTEMSTDLNGDAVTDVQDIYWLLNVMLGREDFTALYRTADMNGDNAVEVDDLNCIINAMLGRRSQP